MTRSYNNNDKDKNNPNSEFSDTDFKNVERSNLSIPLKNKMVSNKIITPFKFVPISSTNSKISDSEKNIKPIEKRRSRNRKIINNNNLKLESKNRK